MPTRGQGGVGNSLGCQLGATGAAVGAAVGPEDWVTGIGARGLYSGCGDSRLATMSSWKASAEGGDLDAGAQSGVGCPEAP